MRTIAILFPVMLAFASSHALAAAGDANYHELPLRLKDKGTINQRITTSKEQIGKTTTPLGSATADYKVAYVETDEGYRVTKTLMKLDAGKVAGAVDPTSSALLQKMANTFSPLTYLADESLSPTRIEDWDTMKVKFSQSIKDMFAAMPGARPDDTAKAEQASNAILGNLTAETAPNLLLPTDRYISIAHNLGLTLNQPLSADGEIPSPLGGGAIAANEKITLTAWDEKANSARITYDFTPDPASLKAYLQSFMPQFMKQMGAPATAIAEFTDALNSGKANDTIVVTNHCDYDVAIDTGLVRNGSCVKTSAIKLMGQQQGKTERLAFSESFAD